MTLASDGLAIARAGIRAVDPGRAVRRNLARTPRGYRVGTHPLIPAPGGELRLVAIGKAAAAMVDVAERIARGRVVGLAATPRGYPSPHGEIPVVFGDHPVPRSDSFRAGAAVLEFVRSVRPVDVILFLVSGGGSATVEVPAAGLSRPEIRRTTEVLLASGAAIGEMNAVRRHLSALKGGRLAQATRARAFATLALSDVVGDSPADIASGPTVTDPSTFADALGVIRRYRIAERLPPGVLHHLRRGARSQLPETPKPSDRRLGHAPFVLAATNRTALDAAVLEARRRGYASRVTSSRLTGETQPVAREFARALLRGAVRPGGRPIALLSGGETTVTLGPGAGRGGRNQEFALAAAEEVAGSSALVLSIGTDGVDGPTDAAGGWTDGTTVDRAEARAVDLRDALRSHASYLAVARLGGLIRTGPTGTNVMDLHVGLWVPERTRWVLPHGLEVLPGPEHWEFPLRQGRFSSKQREWLEAAGVGILAIRRSPRPGRPDWDAVLPREVTRRRVPSRAFSPGTGGSSRPGAAPSSRRRPS